MSKNRIPVMIVDDDKILREMLKIIVSSDALIVVAEASNGEDAIKQAERFKPYLVLLDINMPKMDGLQAIEEIRKISPATRIIMISAEATLDKVTEAINKGAAGFIVKPLTPAKVLDKISTVLKIRL